MGKYSDTLMEHFTSPRNAGSLECPDATGSAGALGSGPFFVLYLMVRDGRIVSAKYQTNGCGATIACGSILTELITDRSLEEAAALTPEEVVNALDGVPPDKLHCPALAVAALRDALGKLGAVGSL